MQGLWYSSKAYSKFEKNVTKLGRYDSTGQSNLRKTSFFLNCLVRLSHIELFFCQFFALFKILSTLHSLNFNSSLLGGLKLYVIRIVNIIIPTNISLLPCIFLPYIFYTIIAPGVFAVLVTDTLYNIVTHFMIGQLGPVGRGKLSVDI